MASNVSSLVGNIRLTAYTGAHGRTVSAQLATLEQSLDRVLSAYRFDRVAIAAADAIDPRAGGVVVVGNTTTVHNYVFGSGINEIDYTDDWRHAESTLESEGSDSYCGMQDGIASIVFVGTRVRFYGFTEANHGIVALSVDDGPEVLVDQYDPIRMSRMFWESPPLVRGSHVLRARVTCAQNPASRYIWVTLERIEIDA